MKVILTKSQWETLGRKSGWMEQNDDSHLDYDPHKPLQIGDVTFDNKDGAGAVSDNIDSNYKGFTILMTPDEFLRLSAPLMEDNISTKLTTNKLGTPFLNCEWVDGKWQVIGHEGRHRAIALRASLPEGTRIPVNVFGKGDYNRARYLSPEMIHAAFISEKGGEIIHPQGTAYLGGRKANGKIQIYKVAKKNDDDPIDFFTARQKGARTIAKAAKEKGGTSILTMWHFSAKDKPYSEVLRSVKTEEPIGFYEDKFNELIKELDVDNMTQKDFQEVMGELEVWGETICRLFKNKKE